MKDIKKIEFQVKQHVEGKRIKKEDTIKFNKKITNRQSTQDHALIEETKGESFNNRDSSQALLGSFKQEGLPKKEEKKKFIMPKKTQIGSA